MGKKKKVKSEKKDVRSQLKEIEKKCSSEEWQPSDMNFVNTGVIKHGKIPYKMSEFALHGLCFRLGVPTPYMRKCPADLAARNMNHWLQQREKALVAMLYKTKDEQWVRGFVTKRYRPYTNTETYDVIVSLINADKVSLPKLSWEKALFSINGPGIKIGNYKFNRFIDIKNSEVGASALRAERLYRPVALKDGGIRLQRFLISYKHNSKEIGEKFTEALEKELADKDISGLELLEKTSIEDIGWEAVTSDLLEDMPKKVMRRAFEIVEEAGPKNLLDVAIALMGVGEEFGNHREELELRAGRMSEKVSSGLWSWK